jgi:hypothetical protein
MPEQAEVYKHPSGLLQLWAGILVPPLAVLANTETSFAVVPFACVNGWLFAPYIPWIVYLIIAAAAGWVAWLNWSRLGKQWPEDGGGVAPRSRFMAAVGLMLSGLCVLAIFAQGVTTMVLGPCQ